MREKLLSFLKALEMAIPPPAMTHHAITCAQFGSDDAGWQDKLALQINHGGIFHCFFIEPGDFDKPEADLVGEIAIGVLNPPANAQLSDTALRYYPE